MTKVKMVLVSIATIGVLFCRAATDEQIKHSLFISNCYVDDADAALAEFRYARQLCGADSNRFARLICEVAHTNNTRVVRGMISDLGTYGTPTQLPFLYSQVGNTEYGVHAVRSILKIEGITSNSVAMVDWYLSLTNKESRLDREDICKFMLDRFAGPQSPVGIRNIVEQSVLGFSMSNTVYNEYFDESLVKRIDGYKYSRRRLRVLRRARLIMEIPYNESFITNAINELVAYPESELPE